MNIYFLHFEIQLEKLQFRIHRYILFAYSWYDVNDETYIVFDNIFIKSNLKINIFIKKNTAFGSIIQALFLNEFSIIYVHNFIIIMRGFYLLKFGKFVKFFLNKINYENNI